MPNKNMKIWETLSKTDPLIEVARGLGIYIGEFT